MVCLQEVVFRGRVGLLRSLAPSYVHAVHRPLGFGVLGGLVTLSRLPVASQRYVVFRTHGRWWNNGWSDTLIRKGFLVTEIEVGARRVTVVNTHLAANYDGDWSPGNRYARLEHVELGQLADAVAGVEPDQPLVVAGDLNVPSGSWLLDEFVRRTGLRDVPSGPGPTWRPAPAGSDYVIDHVLVRGPIDATAELRFREPVRLAGGRSVPLSDHLGIAAALRLG